METNSLAVIGAAYAAGFCLWGIACGTAVLMLRRWEESVRCRLSYGIVLERRDRTGVQRARNAMRPLR